MGAYISTILACIVRREAYSSDDINCKPYGHVACARDNILGMSETETTETLRGLLQLETRMHSRDLKLPQTMISICSANIAKPALLQPN